eukprot:CAMPEP_0184673022 /NCGR_PEP_ID=MMETSP0308-20130426/86442_1 /TAXON_ID=38269 /ORGANISM="Gloeochaete witrockiana, Strain SAG 46.84" /LENGTH=456 /DNA_ID=CAMNT_0027120453 /DNA_START=452 /DNA_END=1822 /DNA_ORIENTATION=-
MTSKKDLQLIEGRRTRLKQACSNCRKAKKKCGEQRPCGRCIRMGKGDGCCDVETDYCLQTMCATSSSGSSSTSSSPQHANLSPPPTLTHILPVGHPHQHQHQTATTQQQQQQQQLPQPQSQSQQFYTALGHKATTQQQQQQQQLPQPQSQSQQFYTALGHNLPPCLPLPLTLQHPQQQFFLLSNPHNNGQLQQTTGTQECFSSTMFPPVFGTTTTTTAAALYFHPNFAQDEPMPESPMYQHQQQQQQQPQHYNAFNYQQQHFPQQAPNASFPHYHAGETNNSNSNFTTNLASEIFYEACVSDSSLAISGAPSSTSLESGSNSGFSTPRCCGAAGDHSDHDAVCSADQNTLMTDDTTWSTLWAPEHSMSLPTDYDFAWASDSLLSSNTLDQQQQQQQFQQQPQQQQRQQQQQMVFVNSEPLSTLYAPPTFYSYAYVEPPALFSFPDGSVYGLNPECC